ncbi:hypothetical protein MRX96_005001 [Rhipicephalus microplus]
MYAILEQYRAETMAEYSAFNAKLESMQKQLIESAAWPAQMDARTKLLEEDLTRSTYFIVLLGAVDSDYKFVIVDVGAYGKQSDGGVLEQSKFGCRLENRKILIPPDLELPNTSHPAPCVFVGDEAFQLRTDFLRPYPGRGLEGEKRIFNYRLSRAR